MAVQHTGKLLHALDGECIASFCKPCRAVTPSILHLLIQIRCVAHTRHCVAVHA